MSRDIGGDLDYQRTPDFWNNHHDWTGEALAREYGGDGAHWRRAKRKTTEPKGVRGIAVFDLHYPHHSKKLWANILKFTEDFQPDVFVFGGDNLNADAFDHWKKEKKQYRQLEGVRVRKDYEGFQRDVLDRLPLTDDCRRIFMLGNHEKWIEDYIDSHPEVEGYFEVEKNLALDDWEMYEYGQSAEVGKLHFLHGLYCLQHHAAKHVTVYHRSVVYGHLHTLQSYTEVTPLDSDAHTAFSIPCACDQNPDYMRNKPSAWIQGFGVFYVQPDGTFNVYPVTAFDGHFTAPTGVTY